MNVMDSKKIGGSPGQGQVTQLLEGLERLRGELGAVGEELIALLRGAGVSVSPRAEPATPQKTGTAD
jgi:hypothetical protein